MFIENLLGPWQKYEGSPIIKRSEKVNGPGKGMFILKNAVEIQTAI